MILVHFQRAGHQPYALIGGATGMVGDPSGKSQERNLLNQDDLQRNIEGVQKQLSKFLDFETKFAFFTIQGLSKSTIQKSASLPIDRFPLLIFKLLAGLEVKA